MMKRGLTHVEMVVSFLIFIGVLGLIFMFIQPFESSQEAAQSFDNVRRQIIKDGTAEVRFFSILIGTDGSNFPLIIQSEEKENVAVFKKDKTRIGASKEPNGEIKFDYDSAGNFVEVRFSEIFDSFPVGSIQSNPSKKYKIASSRNEFLLSQKKLQLLKDEYDSNYLGLKERKGFSSGVDFNFKVDTGTSGGGILIGTDKKPTTIGEVYSRSERRQFIKADGSIVFVDFIITVW